MYVRPDQFRITQICEIQDSLVRDSCPWVGPIFPQSERKYSFPKNVQNTECSQVIASNTSLSPPFVVCKHDKLKAMEYMYSQQSLG